MLFLDDEQARHDLFALKFNCSEIFNAYDVIEFERLLMEHQFDSVWLDHDLGTQTGTGMDAVRVLLTLPENRRNEFKVYLHTCNPVAIHQMAATLAHAGFKVRKVPFHTWY